MSYTPTNWNTGDTITASALNKIEQGIANAGSISVIDAVIYFPNSTVGYQIYGDFETAIAKARQGIPVMVAVVDSNIGSGSIEYWFTRFYTTQYEEAYPNRINIIVTGGVGYYWTASGIEYYD